MKTWMLWTATAVIVATQVACAYWVVTAVRSTDIGGNVSLVADNVDKVYNVDEDIDSKIKSMADDIERMNNREMTPRERQDWLDQWFATHPRPSK